MVDPLDAKGGTSFNQPSGPIAPDHPATPYTLSTKRQRIYLTYLLGFLSLASSLTATIYFPLIPLLSAHFTVSIQAINLTITLYIVFQAIAPALFAPISDSLGRRPVFLFILVIYTAASLGLALNDKSYTALLILRALQSLGGSAVLAIAYGVVADVAVPAERGKMLGPMLAAGNLGPCIGPVIGGWVALGSGGFRWCFWTLFIFANIALMLVGWSMPETARSVVGNMGVPAMFYWRTWWSLWTALGSTWRTRRNAGPIQSEKVETANSRGLQEATLESNPQPLGKGKFVMKNPFTCLRIIFWKDTALTLWLGASSYAVWYCIQTSIPPIYKTIYHLNELQVGLCFLTGGAGVIIGSFIAGRLLDRNYKLTAKVMGLAVDRFSGNDIYTFPIEKARSRGSLYWAGLSVTSLVGYGWTVERHAHPSIPLILQCLIGAICTIVLQTFNALLVDIFPENPSTAAASGNITRCSLSAAAIAVVDPLINAIGYNWFFTMIGIINGGGGAIAIILIQRSGMSWRQMRSRMTGDRRPDGSWKKGVGQALKSQTFADQGPLARESLGVEDDQGVKSSECGTTNIV